MSPTPSYGLISGEDLKDPRATKVNKALREHLDEINRLAGLSGPVQIVNSVSAGTNAVSAGSFQVGTAMILTGNVPPEGSVIAPPGSMYLYTKGGAGATLWVKETGSSKTGWVAK